MTQWFAIFIPIIAVILLLALFRKHVVWWEILVLLVPSSLLILLMQVVMINSLTADTEFYTRYITHVNYYEDWNERVSCRHPIYCTRSYPCGKSTCTSTYVCGHHHAYDVDYHPQHWTKTDNKGSSYSISKAEYLKLQRQFATKTYFVDLKRHYHSNDGDLWVTRWNRNPETSDNVTFEHDYTNKIKASHSIFKFEDISEEDKKEYALYEYPKVAHNYQSLVLGKKISSKLNNRLQFINGLYGSKKEFKMFILYFKDQPIEAAFKQKSYWEGGNKNEFVICIGEDASGNMTWNKAFSWMDKPDLETRVEGFLTDADTADLRKLAMWLPKHVESDWQRKHFKDFDYIEVELTEGQLTWILILVMIYNIAAGIWVVKNEW